MVPGLSGAYCDLQLRSVLEASSVRVSGVGDYASVHNDTLLFAKHHRLSSTIMVTTSTAGGRPPSHEISTKLLDVVLNAIRSSGYSGRLSVADGTAFGQPYEDECERLGFAAVALPYDAEIIDLNRAPSVGIGHGWMAARPYLDADCRVSLVKAKTHRRFGVSLCLKSALAAVSGVEHGYPKIARGHSWVPWLVERLHSIHAPTLSVVDGVGGIQGEGPMSGTPTDSRFVVSGSPAVAVDVRASIEMGFDPTLVPLLLACVIRGRWSEPSGTRLDEPSPEFDWRNYRLSSTDFLPSRSCYWLHRSVRRRRSSPRRRKAVDRLIADILREEPDLLRGT